MDRFSDVAHAEKGLDILAGTDGANQALADLRRGSGRRHAFDPAGGTAGRLRALFGGGGGRTGARADADERSMLLRALSAVAAGALGVSRLTCTARATDSGRK
jgi:hypothetical protein